MRLPNDFARCDGLLPKLTELNGKALIAWVLDCPRRDDCARYCQNERDDPSAFYSYISHHHGADETCADFIQENTNDES